VTERVKALVAATASGTLSRDDFPYGWIGRFIQFVAIGYQRMLKDRGGLQWVDLLSAEDLGDDRQYTYALTFAKAFAS
jgi:hypothetical protein